MGHCYVLFSGGVDSTLAMLKIAKQGERSRITPLFFDYGQKAAEKEKEAVGKLIPLLRERVGDGVVIGNCRIHEVGGTGLFPWSRSSILKGRSDTVSRPDVENRNMVLISLAVSVIMADRNHDKAERRGRSLVVGFRNEHYDTKRAFATRMDAVTSRDPFGVKIITPLVSSDYAIGWHSLSRQFASEDIEFLLPHTWSCYSPTGKGLPCGRCGSCRSRARLVDESGTRSRMKR
jgi:7-cyano-7-deazaguanine synthase in queuosine biosynthesis